MEAIVKDRNGSVLGKGSILKMYFFPGQRTSSHIQIHGAPNVFKVCLRIYVLLEKLTIIKFVMPENKATRPVGTYRIIRV